MSSGYIRLSRKFFDGPLWNQSRTFSPAEAWLDLIQMARFEAETTIKLLPNGRMITIERGEIHASLRFLSARWGWSKGKVERFICNNPGVGRRTVQGETVLKLCNYEAYNPSPSLSRTVNGTRTGQRRDSGGTKLIKGNKENSEKETNLPTLPPPGEERDFGFDEFWDLYDKKVGDRRKLEARWERIPRVDREKIFDYIPRYKEANPDKQYRKNPETFLNNKSWMDEIIERKKPGGAVSHPAAQYDNKKTFEKW